MKTLALTSNDFGKFKDVVQLIGTRNKNRFVSTYTKGQLLETPRKDIVHLSTKENISHLGNSYGTLKNVIQIERTLAKNLFLKKLYVDFMHEYEDLGHIEHVNSIYEK